MVKAGEYSLTPENLNKWIGTLKNRNATPQFNDPFKPKNMGEYIGQSKAKRVASIIVDAAKKDGRPLPSTLITGQFGQGKTALARIMADAYDPTIQLVDAASVNKFPPTKGTFIIDEIHNLGPDICDSFNIAIDNNDIHIIGCSTDPGQLPAAFRSRFRQIYLETYTEKDISVILKQVINKKNLIISPSVLTNITQRSRLNPRAALNYLAFIFDLVTLQETSLISEKIVNKAFEELGVDKKGYLDRDFVYLNALPTDGRPVGLQYLSAMTHIDEETIKQEVEPYLMQQGLIDRKSKGRVLIKAVG